MPFAEKPQRPDDIRYWFNDRPPLTLTLLLAIQLVAFLGSIMTLPVVLGRAAGLSPVEEANLVALTMIVAGVGVVLQALNRHGIGIGLLSPMHTSGVAFPAALAAVKTGGLGLAFGMMSVAGLVQVAASQAMPRLRALFPVEIAGLTVFMLGLGLGLVGLKGIVGINTQWEGLPEHHLVGLFTLGVIILFNIWSPGLGRAFSVFIGLVSGQCLSWYMELIPAQAFTAMVSAIPFAVPAVGSFGWSFDWVLLPDFIIVGLALSFNNFGVLTIAQRANNAAWKRPDMQGIGRGLMAEGLTNIAGSFINGVTQTASGGAIGLTQASGITSRVVAFVLGGLFIVLAFFPPVTMLWSTLSPAVIGAVLMFVGCFISIGGLRILTSRLLDNRKIITLGIAAIAGLGHDTILIKVDGLPSFLEPAFATPISITILIAILLNTLFRIGSKKRLDHDLILDEKSHESVNRLIWSLGREWGARPEVVARLEHATNELIDTINSHDLISLTTQDKVNISTVFDEYGCKLKIVYQGQPFNMPEKRPEPEQLLEDPQAVHLLAGYLIRRLADTVKVSASHGRVTVLMHFND